MPGDLTFYLLFCIVVAITILTTLLVVRSGLF